jgi:hypothetical protein
VGVSAATTGAESTLLPLPEGDVSVAGASVGGGVLSSARTAAGKISETISVTSTTEDNKLNFLSTCIQSPSLCDKNRSPDDDPFKPITMASGLISFIFHEIPDLAVYLRQD